MKFITVIFALFISNGISAAAGWTSLGIVTEINQQPASGVASEQVFITGNFTFNPSDAASCTVRDGFYFSITDQRTERIFSMFLSAYMAKKEVKIYTTGECHTWGYAKLDGVIIK